MYKYLYIFVEMNVLTSISQKLHMQ